MKTGRYVFYYSQPSKGVRSPRRSLQTPVSEVTSKRQGLCDSRRRRHHCCRHHCCRHRGGNSQVARRESLLWRHRRDHKRSPGDTGQSFDPIREKYPGRGVRGRAFMNDGLGELVGCHFEFQRQNTEQRQQQQPQQLHHYLIHNSLWMLRDQNTGWKQKKAP